MTKQIFTAGSALALGLGGILTAAVPAAPAASAPAAQVRVAKFAIPNMTCPTCPITVKKAMQGVAGVRSVSVDLNTKTATVAFDASKANIAAIAAASTNAGFPAKPAR
jgi:periplasmic mercuric ion binding protein